ncbi:regulator of nucleoside diphosphate kinase [Xanthobacter flavus]|uniref:Nucleoside diphosphate kinase regulator n=1 Tax=Xanthobacter flavus TaxID=281 RepID=A0A9W6CSP0_XANFL|nr:nucleoside diphosphate kinase regulator [Xanthobacter flavus]MDR6334840.1 regulator of nucleoside diphosphate kinase [Xanthobacter flavus]GLI23138.1 nucleoside diphosphate kinase regulator [Xanthobacter flavus]
MTKPSRRARLPALVLNRDDHERLTGLATAALDRIPDVAEELLSELERARLVSPDRTPANSVQMGATVTYRSADSTRTVRLVYPEDADIADGKVSVMTPIGAALIGLSENQSISWTARDGRRHELEIVAVAPAPAQARV